MESIRQKIYGDIYPYLDFNDLVPDEQGWSSDSPIFEEIIKEIKPKIIVEVGTWKGCSAIHMAKTCLKYYDDFEIVCVDTFMGSVEHWTGTREHVKEHKNGRPQIYDKFLSNVIKNNLQKYITPLPVDSINGYFILEKHGVEADLVYIDAGHDYYSVRMDLIHYSKLVRNGGYLLGDDWFHEPIKTAAYETFGEDKVIEKTRDKFLWIK